MLQGKRAIMKIAAEIMDVAVSVLTDGGLRVTGSVSSSAENEGIVCLIIAGDKLPDICANEWRLVSPLLMSESYGRQRITRIAEVVDLGPYEADVRRLAS